MRYQTISYTVIRIYTVCYGGQFLIVPFPFFYFCFHKNFNISTSSVRLLRILNFLTWFHNLCELSAQYHNNCIIQCNIFIWRQKLLFFRIPFLNFVQLKWILKQVKRWKCCQSLTYCSKSLCKTPLDCCF